MGSESGCTLLGGIFALAIQASLAILCIGTLVIKRHHEIPRRDWYVWFLDVMKQGIGSSFGHFCNIALSLVIANNVPDADQCQWYGFTYIVDSVFGTMLNLSFLHCFELILKKFPKLEFLNFGDYGDPPTLRLWIPQLCVWLTIVTIGKLIILFILLQFTSQINTFVKYSFQSFSHQAQVELLMVMIVIPTILNTVQFWVTDTFLKRQTNANEISTTDLDEELIIEDEIPSSQTKVSPQVRTKKSFRKGSKRIPNQINKTTNGKYTRLQAEADDINSNSSNNNVVNDGDMGSLYTSPLSSLTYLNRLYTSSPLSSSTNFEIERNDSSSESIPRKKTFDQSSSNISSSDRFVIDTESNVSSSSIPTITIQRSPKHQHRFKPNSLEPGRSLSFRSSTSTALQNPSSNHKMRNKDYTVTTSTKHEVEKHNPNIKKNKTSFIKNAETESDDEGEQFL